MERHRKKKRRNRLFDLAVYAMARLLEVVLAALSDDAAYAVARLFGDLIYRFDRRHRVRALEHLRRSFPTWPDEEVRRVARQSIRSLAYLGGEMVLTPRRINLTSYPRYTHMTNMAGHLRTLMGRNGAVIYLTSHLGNWEMLGYYMAVQGFPGIAIARPLDNPYLDRYVRRVRSRAGLMVFDKKGVTGRMDQALTGKGAVCFLSDQDAGRKGIFVDFFGRKASTFKSIALLAIRYDVPILVACARRLGAGCRFEIRGEQIIVPADWAGRDDPVRWITQQYTSAIERAVRRAPEQYMWVHRRWKHRPPGEQRSPDGIA